MSRPSTTGREGGRVESVPEVSAFGPYEDDRTLGVRHHGQADGADHEVHHAAQATGSEHQRFGVLRGVGQSLGRPAGDLFDEHVDLRVGRPAAFLGRFTRYPLAPVLVGLGAEQRGLGDGLQYRSRR